MCVRFQNTLSWFGVLGLKLHISSYFDHYYPALCQEDLSVLFTVKTQQFTCKGWSHMEKYGPTGRNVEEGSRVKEHPFYPCPCSLKRNVSSAQRVEWDDGLESSRFTWAFCSQQESPEQSMSSLVCVHVQSRQQLGRLTAPLHYNPCISKDMWGELECILVTFHANLKTGTHHLNEFTFSFDKENLLLGLKSLIWPK